jgi:all-trans-8'-apo-beta-carotenal 15,15'-oxygenase
MLWRVSPPGWSKAFQDLPREHGFEPLRVEGTLPEDLQGTLYRVGPGLFSGFGKRYEHWFDGDGTVSAVRFGGGGAQGAARVIETEHRVRERRAGRMKYLRYGTVIPGGPLQRMRLPPRNAASTSLFRWQNRLFALYEPSRPTELDPNDLSTLGEKDLGGVVPQAFSAHPRPVPERRAAYNFGTRFGLGWMVLDLFELPDTGRARRLATLPLPAMSLIHDFIATPRCLVFLIPPMRFHMFRMFLGQGPLARNIEFDPTRGTEVIVVPIDDPENPVRFTVDPFFQWHFANAFEERGEIVLDLVRYPDFKSNRLMEEFVSGQVTSEVEGQLYRMRIHAARRRLSAEQLWDVPCEYPHMSPAMACRDGRYLYLGANSAEGRWGPQDLLAKRDHLRGRTETVAPGPGQYPSEPLFVPRRGATEEDDGYLLSLVYDSRRHASHMAVFDARHLDAGPLARAWFDQHIPFTVHGLWVPA